jgi:hypothetical protein
VGYRVHPTTTLRFLCKPWRCSWVPLCGPHQQAGLGLPTWARCCLAIHSSHSHHQGHNRHSSRPHQGRNYHNSYSGKPAPCWSYPSCCTITFIMCIMWSIYLTFTIWSMYLTLFAMIFLSIFLKNSVIFLSLKVYYFVEQNSFNYKLISFILTLKRTTCSQSGWQSGLAAISIGSPAGLL